MYIHMFNSVHGADAERTIMHMSKTAETPTVVDKVCRNIEMFGKMDHPFKSACSSRSANLESL